MNRERKKLNKSAKNNPLLSMICHIQDGKLSKLRKWDVNSNRKIFKNFRIENRYNMI